MTPTPPSPAELLRARAFLAKHYPHTPLYPAPRLSRVHGGEIYVKYENQGPVRSFKGPAARSTACRG